ncbi:unannotated protein [freshwater metagenome]|uniref:Unannotated protein n=1 Tax=freshwater metagenome TaxID=449393 RepID=A0A6J7K2C0_9ZZZZ|nr:hypothetical protein [Actinomycetota bacterium]
MTKPKDSERARPENVLAFMMVGVIGVSILTIVLVLLSYLFKFELPHPISLIPLIGLPFGALLLIALLIVQARKLTKAKR